MFAQLVYCEYRDGYKYKTGAPLHIQKKKQKGMDTKDIESFRQIAAGYFADRKSSITTQ